MKIFFEAYNLSDDGGSSSDGSLKRNIKSSVSAPIPGQSLQFLAISTVPAAAAAAAAIQYSLTGVN